MYMSSQIFFIHPFPFPFFTQADETCEVGQVLAVGEPTGESTGRCKLGSWKLDDPMYLPSGKLTVRP